jgi:hypothetical protein
MTLSAEILAAYKLYAKSCVKEQQETSSRIKAKRICVELLDGRVYHPASKTYGLCTEPLVVRLRDMFAAHIREIDGQPGVPTKMQAEFICDDAPYVALLAGVGSGKSVAGAVSDLEDAICNPNTSVLIGAPSHASLWDNCIPAIEKILCHPSFEWLVVKPRLPHHEGKCGREQHRIYRIKLINGSVLVFRSLEHKSGASKRIQGPTYSGGRIEEASQCPESVWQLFVERVRDGSGRRMQLRLTTSLDRPGWLERRFLAPAVDRRFFHTVQGKTRDATFRDATYDTNLRASLGEFAYRRKAEARLLYESGLVYGEKYLSQNRQHPCWREYQPLGNRVLFGVDFGYRKPYVVFAEECEIDGEIALVCIGEIVASDIDCRQLGRLIGAKAKEEGWTLLEGYTDYSASSDIDRDSIQAGIGARVRLLPAVWPGREKYWRVPQGVDLVRQICVEPRRLYLSAVLHDTDYNSVELHGIYGMIGGYHYPEHTEGNPLKGQPVKDGINDHPADGLRYLCLGWAADRPTPGSGEREQNAEDDEADL